MGNTIQTRRTDVLISVNGVDISADIKKYLLSLTYTDEEEDKSDDISIQLDDRDGEWLYYWLNSDIQSDCAASGSSSGALKTGDSVRIRRGATDYDGTNLQSWVYDYDGFTVIEVSTSKPDRIVIGINGVVTAAMRLSDLIFDNASDVSPSGSFSVGQNVRIRQGATDYNGATLQSWVYSYERFTVIEIGAANPNRIVIGIDGVVTAAMRAEDLYASDNGGSTGTAKTKNGLSGATISAGIVQIEGGKRMLLDCGTFEIDTIRASGPPSRITLKATSLPVSSAVRSTKRNKAWENIKLSAIGSQIASRCGMQCRFYSDFDPVYKRQEQAGESDIVFLQRLCKAAGLALKCTANSIVMFDEAEYERKDVAFSIEKGKADVLNWSFSDGTTDTAYSSCHVSYTNENGVTIEYTYTPRVDNPGTGQVLEISEKVESREEARQLAMKRLRQKNKDRFSASLTLIGSCSAVAGVTVNIIGWGSFDGKYLIERATHSVSGSGGYTTSVELHKVLEEY